MLLEIGKWLIINLDGIAPLLPLFIIVKNAKSGLLKELFFLFYFFYIQATYNFLADILSYDDVESNYWVFHINLPLSLLSLCFFFYQNKTLLFYTRFFFITGIGLVVFSVADSLFLETISTFNSLGYFLASCYLIVICLHYFWAKTRTESESDILEEPFFWIISGFFIYYTSSLAVFAAYRFFIRYNDQFAGTAWCFNNIMLLAMCVLASKGIIKYKHACPTLASS